MPNAFGVLSPNLTYSKPSWVDSEFLQKVMGWGKFVFHEIAFLIYEYTGNFQFEIFNISADEAFIVWAIYSRLYKKM